MEQSSASGLAQDNGREDRAAQPRGDLKPPDPRPCFPVPVASLISLASGNLRSRSVCLVLRRRELSEVIYPKTLHGNCSVPTRGRSRWWEAVVLLLHERLRSVKPDTISTCMDQARITKRKTNRGKLPCVTSRRSRQLRESGSQHVLAAKNRDFRSVGEGNCR